MRSPKYYHHLAISFGLACGSLTTWIASLVVPSNLWLVPVFVWALFILHLIGGE